MTLGEWKSGEETTKGASMANQKMQFMLKGFSQVMGFRVFEFEGTVVGSPHIAFTVQIDLSLARKYGIPLQDLPLLCRGVLDQCPEGEEQRAFTYTEAHMSSYATNPLPLLTSGRAQKRSPRPPGTDYLPSPWPARPR
jgi:hypothetical protein